MSSFAIFTTVVQVLKVQQEMLEVKKTVYCSDSCMYIMLHSSIPFPTSHMVHKIFTSNPHTYAHIYAHTLNRKKCYGLLKI